MEATINQWYYLGNGHWYIYYDDVEKCLKRSCHINYNKISNYLFNIIVTDHIDKPNLYTNIYYNNYDKVPIFNITCKAIPNSIILPTSFDIYNKIVNTNRPEQEYKYDKMYWMLGDYDDLFNIYDNKLLEIGSTLTHKYNELDIENFICLDRLVNKIYSFDCCAESTEMYIDGLSWRNLKLFAASNEYVDETNDIINICGENMFKEENIIYIFSSNSSYNKTNNTIYLTTIGDGKQL